jgi:hypothetical protein
MADIGGFDLMVYRWRQRLLLLFSASSAVPDYRHQMRLLVKEESALGERHLLLVHLFAEEPSRLGDEELPPGTAEDLRAQFRVQPTLFTVVLVGLDGTEKLRSAEPLQPNDMFSAIDAMPMRQRELQRRADWA